MQILYTHIYIYIYLFVYVHRLHMDVYSQQLTQAYPPVSSNIASSDVPRLAHGGLKCL